MLFSHIVSFVADAAILSTGVAAVRHFTNYSLTGLLIYLNSGEMIFNKGLEIVKNSSSKNKF
ncbi:hypothetical protein DICPUDRAFT_33450 [Dictyostelium purpureum]|uniref:Uncharacterized protein n=1 Tax=Dictyostelium purpureum TaxID=5786 RepID=F0ZKT8_DICPU|nr:uncharacterized protein DICPUDRAFT_33450 [Dictyostelium purpureum]EGC35416.1 hypothetical protein DICPUDRAFT_33450 [Dictyostelium purpureum]|eukprot:XP_003288029.1 hypothetical protein DICPUDRAFT_33450 [Dictyostelium purpureum]